MKTFQVPNGGPTLPLMDIHGKEYLVVAYRLVWFRFEHPTWTIKTHIEYNLEKKYCVAKAEISSDAGILIASGHKMETEQGFADYIEKAETGAIGRALAMCGYGTQFAPELDEAERIVDAPIARAFQLPPRGSNSGALCDICGTGLTLSKSGKGYYCPNFKNVDPRGDHTRINADELEAFKKARGDIPQ